MADLVRPSLTWVVTFPKVTHLFSLCCQWCNLPQAIVCSIATFASPVHIFLFNAKVCTFTIESCKSRSLYKYVRSIACYQLRFQTIQLRVCSKQSKGSYISYNTTVNSILNLSVPCLLLITYTYVLHSPMESYVAQGSQFVISFNRLITIDWKGYWILIG